MPPAFEACSLVGSSSWLDSNTADLPAALTKATPSFLSAYVCNASTLSRCLARLLSHEAIQIMPPR
ncbi:uncharacterized protein L969DRAFT_87794, partial [Mixia osmundae IAM 14324]|uniref:uncharacterized protein n=1 Tax=Mixia osmundae (strain CBS 9802 / IAM 14324 / JCM 22182 / KY 12970) TaxID=764103 RepID=UPI0004A5464D